MIAKRSDIKTPMSCDEIPSAPIKVGLLKPNAPNATGDFRDPARAVGIMDQC
jgi:hypothetical protein